MRVVAWMRSPCLPGRDGAARCVPVASVLVLLLLAVAPALVRAQDEGEAPEDSTATTSPLAEAGAAAAAGKFGPDDGRFYLGMTREPKVGLQANVQKYSMYGTLTTTGLFRSSAQAVSSLEWSWDNYRKQQKTVDSRKGGLRYSFGKQLPLVTVIDGSWNWSEDRTTNTAGYANLFKMDNKLVNLTSSQQKFQALGLVNSVRLGANFNDQTGLNQNQRSKFSEGTTQGGLQSGWALSPGVVVAGRLSGTATGGTRELAGSTSPSSAHGDSLGVGVYFNRGVGTGFVAMTRSSFAKKYLEFRRNANGLVDTVGLDEADKVVTELETRDAVSLDFAHRFKLGRLGGEVKAGHTTDDQKLATGVAGLKQRAQDSADMTLSFDAGRDSLVAYARVGESWDDQRIKAATASRGRQYVRRREFQINWYRTLFKATRMNLQYHEELTQDVAEKRFNENDKDRLQIDFAGKVERAWAGKFRTNMVFSYRQTQDISIRGSSSSNNNLKDSYELVPGFSWNVTPWITFDQNYRLYIQYADYLYSYLPTVTRKDDYNKRGDLVTKVLLVPNQRLRITIRHDFNRRFNATKSLEDAAGSAFYHRDLEQDIAKIRLDMTYTVAPGVSIDCGTYRTRDDKTSIGRTNTTSRTDSGELVIGTRVDRTLGAKQDFEVSAMIKKINAYGPSVTASSADFWEADVWFKWMF
jgi:hypothetical protein